MKIKSFLSFVFVFFVVGYASAQDDLLSQLDAVKSDKKEIETAAFKALQICNMQSTKLPVKGEFYVLISHRFGDLAKGLDNFFGLDQAYTKIGGIYGVTNWFSLGASRQTHGKIYELTAKYKFANQEAEGFPVTIVGYNTMDINSELKKNDLTPGLKFNNRLAYTTQLLVSRKFSDSFSFELAPIYVHKNLYDGILDQKDLLLLGSGARYKLSKRLSVNLEYAARLNLPEGFTSPYHNPLSAGLDIETGGHVFQLIFSNSQPMNDVTLFSNTEGRWDGKKQLYFGFNMYRVF
ncbi:DUF5777 family beta-barrel protein [Flavobacterium psychrotolerans]|uniref:DUF5777 domain-containing protein n=1 Tax=Flavobacterium psychrotolerans TaxID=2169410 RepID=A0A2U1JQF4_9FLAO|nr:DUF5777 family beta-barrel protein [Flavobacterium psychrotolerans]PWA07245.1 hypothetical protein DB895_00540 [Flavobacterium psychrotolerans]